MALAWCTAGLLGLPQLARIPFLPAWPAVTAVGAWLATTRFGWLCRAQAVVLLGLVLGSGFTPAVDAGARALVRDEAIAGQRFDAIVVLSAGLTRDGVLNPAGSERLLHGVTLFGRGAAPVIVTTRIRRAARGDTLTSDQGQARLLALAGGSVDWRIVDSVATTRDEARQVAALATASGWSRVVVVTSPLHTRRACAAFRGAGLAIACSAAPSTEHPVTAPLSPGDRWRVLSPLLHEVIGWWWYRVRGWV